MSQEFDTDRWHTHGDGGQKPPNGTEWAGGDQYEAQYADYLHDQQRVEQNELIDAHERRVTDFYGDVLFGGGVATESSLSTDDIDVSAISGAYVNGEKVGSVSGTSLSLATNSSTSNRTDYVYLTASESISIDEGSFTSNGLLLSEVTVDTSSTITNINNVGVRHAPKGSVGSWPEPSSTNYDHIEGETLYERSTEEYGVYDNGKGWRKLLFADGNTKREETQDYAGNDIINVGNLYDRDGTSFTDKFVNENGDTMTGTLEVNGPNLFYNKNGDGFQLGNENDVDRGFIAPIINGTVNYQKELSFQDEWDIEGSPKAGGKTIATQPWVRNTHLSSENDDTVNGQLDFRNDFLLGNNFEFKIPTGDIGNNTGKINFIQTSDDYSSVAFSHNKGTFYAQNGSNYKFFNWDLSPEYSELKWHDDITVNGIHKTTGEHIIQNENPTVELRDTSNNNLYTISVNSGNLSLKNGNGFGLELEDATDTLFISDENGNKKEVESI